jgi:Holliday junction resolvasome RuvABC endonuclease subunit
MIILGIDPGINGACAVYDSEEDKVLKVFNLPTKDRDYGTGKQIDARVLFFQIQAIIARYFIETAAVENVGPMPKQGPTSSFSFGCTVCSIRAVLEIIGLPIIPIHAAQWKAKFGLTGAPKERIVNALKESYPETEKLLCGENKVDRGEAVAIAIYCGDYM